MLQHYLWEWKKSQSSLFIPTRRATTQPVFLFNVINNLLLQAYFIFYFLWVLAWIVYLAHIRPCKRPKTVTDILCLQLQLVMNHSTKVLGTQLGSSERIASALDNWAISLGSQVCRLNTTLMPCWWELKQCCYLTKQYHCFLKKLNRSTIWPKNSFSRCIHKSSENTTHKNMAAFSRVQRGKQC